MSDKDVILTGIGGLLGLVIGGPFLAIIGGGIGYLVSEATKIRTFISFAAPEDNRIRDLFVGQTKNPDFPIDIIDYSVKEPFDEKWKTQCRERIKKTQLVIVLVGKTTYKAEGVIWEIKAAKEEGIPVFGVYIYKDDKSKIPEGLSGRDLIEWKWEGIANKAKELVK